MGFPGSAWANCNRCVKKWQSNTTPAAARSTLGNRAMPPPPPPRPSPFPIPDAPSPGALVLRRSPGGRLDWNSGPKAVNTSHSSLTPPISFKISLRFHATEPGQQKERKKEKGSARSPECNLQGAPRKNPATPLSPNTHTPKPQLPGGEATCSPELANSPLHPGNATRVSADGVFRAPLDAPRAACYPTAGAGAASEFQTGLSAGMRSFPSLGMGLPAGGLGLLERVKGFRLNPLDKFLSSFLRPIQGARFFFFQQAPQKDGQQLWLLQQAAG